MDKLRPWLAQLTLTSAFYEGRKFSVVNGADVRILAFAMTQKKPVQYLETPRQQLEFFVESVGSFEVANFEALVNNFNDRPRNIETGIAAWREGDVHELSMRLHRGLQQYPEARKILLDNRNAAWAVEIDRLLRDANKSYFITVGVGHLGGPHSVIELLCARGWNVERIATAGERVEPAACTAPLP
jgi:uncharacterized protein YbaP (TraB family)